MNLNEYQTSCFFNLSTTLQSDKLRAHNKADVIVSEKNDFYVNQCLNCHEFFPSISSLDLSHNYWAYNNIKSSKNSDKKEQTPTNNNYFSPIFLKFNLSYVLSSRFYNNSDNKISLIESKQTQQNENQQSNDFKMIKLDHPMSFNC